MHVPLYDDADFDSSTDEFVNADDVVFPIAVVCAVDTFVKVGVAGVVGLDECMATSADVDTDLFPLLYPNVAVLVDVSKVVVAVVPEVLYVDDVADILFDNTTDEQSMSVWQQYNPDWQSESRLHRTGAITARIILIKVK